MSYSINIPCSGCTKEDKCSDRHFVYGAVQGIYQMSLNENFGHMGAGDINLNCFRKEEIKKIEN